MQVPEAGAEVIHACMLATENIRNINFQVLNTASHYMDSKHFPKLKGVIGPIFSSEARRYGTLFAHVPVLALSNDRALDDGHLYACGLSPQDEIRTIIEYGKSRKIESFLVFPKNPLYFCRIRKARIPKIRPRNRIFIRNSCI